MTGLATLRSKLHVKRDLKANTAGLWITVITSVALLVGGLLTVFFPGWFGVNQVNFDGTTLFVFVFAYSGFAINIFIAVILNPSEKTRDVLATVVGIIAVLFSWVFVAIWAHEGASVSCAVYVAAGVASLLGLWLIVAVPSERLEHKQEKIAKYHVAMILLICGYYLVRFVRSLYRSSR